LAKALVTILMSLVFAGGALGCTASSGTTVPEGSTTTLVISGQTIEVRWGETATFAGGIRMVAYAPQVDPRAKPLTPGDVVLYCMVDITNGRSQPFLYEQADFALYAKDRTAIGGLAGGLALPSELVLLSGTLAPGETVQGAVPFELPEDQISTIQRLFFHCHSREEVSGGLNDIGWSVYWGE
jgi:hypothetical protein